MRALLAIVFSFTCTVNGYRIPQDLRNKTVLYIIDGLPVVRGNYPFVVSMQKNGENICGGSIINEDTVITAAHCFTMYPDYEDLQIVAGVVDLTDTDSAQIRSIAGKVIVHPLFSHTQLYDIAVFKVDTPFLFDDFVNAGEIDTELYETLDETKTGFVAGWGLTDEKDPLSASSILLAAEVNILTKEECSDEYGDEVNEGMLCALPHEKNEDACQKDSGGPLIHDNKIAGIIMSDTDTSDMAIRLAVFFGVVALAVAAPQLLARQEIDPNPPQYQFSYSVQDPLTGDSKSQSEARNGDSVQGSYSLVEADGSVRIVDYTADDINGFNAVVHKQEQGRAVVAAPSPVVAARIAAPAPVLRRVVAPALYQSAYSSPYTYY